MRNIKFDEILDCYLKKLNWTTSLISNRDA